MKPVADPELIARLDASLAKPVTDPVLLAQLEGRPIPDAQPKAPGDAIGVTRAALQGATFGFADELGAATSAALQPAVNTAMGLPYQEGFGNRYDAAMQEFKQDREAYQKENPGKAVAAEIGGAVATSLASAPAAATSKAAQLTANLPNWLRLALAGGVQGGAYGAGSADQGERLEGGAKGAVIGAIATPVVAKAFEKVGQFGGRLASWLSSTPEAKAKHALQKIAEAESLSADDIASRIEKLGPEATIADIDEAFGGAARAAADLSPQARQTARNVMNTRQLGQQDRLLATAQQAVGANADDFTQTIKTIAADRSAKASPIYEKAFAQRFALNDNMKSVLQNPEVRRFMKAGQRIAEGEDGLPTNIKFTTLVGDDGLLKEVPPSDLLRSLHYAKMAMDRRIEKFQSATNPEKTAIRGLTKLKNRLLSAMDEISPDYAEARSLYAGDSQLLNAANTGKRIFKLDPEELADTVAGMGASEKELFRLGAMRALREKLDDISMTHDATMRLLGKRSMQKRFESIFPDRDSLDRFVRQAVSEREFTRTRNVLVGGSPTSQRLAGRDALIDQTGPGLVESVITGDKLRAGLTLFRNVVGEKKPDIETINKAADMLLNQGYTRAEINDLFRQPALQRYTSEYLAKLGPPGAIRKAVGAPAAGAIGNQFPDDD